jgi:peptide subunit release factor 1 (eRF1)
VELVQQSRVLQRFFDELARGGGADQPPLAVVGPRETMHALELGAVERLIVWDRLAVHRHLYRHSVTGGTSLFLSLSTAAAALLCPARSLMSAAGSDESQRNVSCIAKRPT